MANFAVKIDDRRWLSFFQQPYDDYNPQEGMETCEVALFEYTQRIGEPARFNDIAELVDILVGIQNDDIKVFTNQFIFDFGESEADATIIPFSHKS